MKQFDITKMRKACIAAAETLRGVGKIIVPGITTDDINRFVHNHTVRIVDDQNNDAYPAPLNYRGFPKSCCTSVNDVVCHGIPGKHVLKNGDIVNVDITTILDGHFGDTNATFLVGSDVTPEVRKLVSMTEHAMYAGIGRIKPGADLNDIGKMIQLIADDQCYGVVKEFGGHGIGVRFHTDPHVCHYDQGQNVLTLKPGMIFTVEPMLNMGSAEVWLDPADGWTVRTVDEQPSAQFEHTCLVTEDGVEILTKLALD